MIGRPKHIFVWFFDFYWLTGSFDLVIFSRSLDRGRLPISRGSFAVFISILSTHPPFFRFPQGGVGWCSEQKVTPLGREGRHIYSEYCLAKIGDCHRMFWVAKREIYADFMACAANFFHQLVDCFRVAVEMLEIEENEGENLGVVPFKIEKQQRYF
jgi:hypothetical protein